MNWFREYYTKWRAFGFAVVGGSFLLMSMLASGEFEGAKPEPTQCLVNWGRMACEDGTDISLYRQEFSCEFDGAGNGDCSITFKQVESE